MDTNPAFFWLIVGIACMALEAFGITGVGFVFAGLAALCVGVFIALGVLATDNHILQAAVFFGSAAAWAAVLWKPMRKVRLNFGKHGSGYSNMVGETAVVSGAGLKAGMIGEVLWSGTVMKAELAPHAQDVEVAVSGQVTIVDVRGATLIVKPK